MSTQKYITIELAESFAVGKAARDAALAEVRAYGAITAHLEKINNMANSMITNGMEVQKVKDHVTAHLEAMLKTASRMKGGNIDTDDDAGKKAREGLWMNIKAAISKKGFFVIAGERPQAKQGSNFLAVWSMPQRKKDKANDSAGDTSDDSSQGENSHLEGDKQPAPKLPHDLLAAALELVKAMSYDELNSLKTAVAEELIAKKPSRRQRARAGNQ
jgi:hypothetical protein